MQNDQNKVVTAVGNSWVVCKSKTYDGKTYYFNTLTGTATWNLSDAEVEKAEKRTQCLNKSESVLKECPEPKEPPVDNAEQKSHQYIYNKKVINNRFSNEPYPITAFVAPQCNYVVPPCSSGSQMGLTLPSQNYNPEVWSVPPTHQILIAPTRTSIVSQSQMPVNMQYTDRQHIPVQNTSVPLTRRFQIKSPSFNNSRHTSANCYKFAHGMFQRNFWDKPNDLREVLSYRRKLRQSADDNRDISNTNDSENGSNNSEEREPVPCISFEKKTNINEIKDDTYLSETESIWPEENVKVQGTKLYLDITCLRNLAAPDADPDTWYIAVDRTILLHHLKFLNMLINSDEDCQLLVPREELGALRQMTGSAEVAARTPRLSNRARRALNFVLQQFDSLCAVQGEELETNSTSSHVLNCCLNVADQNYQVILLSNDDELLAQKESVNITMFSMDELKAFLTKSKGHETKGHPTSIPPESAIRITIPNDFAKDPGVHKTFEIVSVTTEEHPKQDSSKKPANNIEVPPAPKVTIDTGVQTDFLTPTVEVKRREIKLKRSSSNQTNNNQSINEQNSNTKQFRWRRKRNACSATNDASSQTNSSTMNNSTSTSEDVEKTSDVDSGKRGSQLSAESGKHNYVFDSNVEGYSERISDTSSNVCIQKNVHERITIEETSTSGVISNTSFTASNHDGESVTNEFLDQFKTRSSCNTDEQEDRMKNNYMFEITNPQVKEYLRMRSDEWISRFVQIMEEVLSQVLQRNNAMSFHLTPPPWTVQEALQCILRSSDYYGDVKDAAKKLSTTLFNMSDETGKINIELIPADFMEMYSYGVYLVDALQGIAKDCEDLQTASDSLAKLLKDIQEPNLDTTHSDAFGERNQEVSMNTDEPDNSMNVDNIVNEDQSTHYNLRSKKSSPFQQSAVRNRVIKFIRNVDVEANFFTSLNLKKRIFQKIEGSNFDNGERLENGLFNKKSNDLETKFVRRFSKSIEFEERLSQREPLDLDQLDYSANYDDNYECTEDEYYDEVEDQFDDREIDNITYNEYIGQQYPTQSPDINGNTVLYEIIQTFLKEIKDSLTQVQVFCKNADHQLSENGPSSSKRKAIHDKAAKAYICIENIVNSLNSIVYRESYKQKDSMHSLLKTAGIEGFDLNNKLFSHYRATIVKCIDQANILLEVVFKIEFTGS